MRAPIFYAAMLLIVSSSVLAAQPDCANAVTQADMDQCASISLKASDAKLNQTYKALLAKVSKDGKVKLQKAQRAWIGWRDAQCDFIAAGSSGGTIHSMAQASCINQLTQAQTKLLDSQLHCQEGDVSCGNQ
ncbi:MAG TPA: lysozyme inhibitor LprI family protein [Paraburkholderia sp.]|nr:lysozyme inhibitor LprI family protein [Paraburkholderia sp.]